MKKMLPIIFILLTNFIFSQCDEYSVQNECDGNNSCQWVENMTSWNCSNFGNSSTCENYSEYGCSWEFSWGGWQNYGSYCAGGSFQINNSYCVEESVLLGDANGDGSLEVSDMVLIINFILNSEYNEPSDMNQDGILNVIDIVELVDRILGS